MIYLSVRWTLFTPVHSCNTARTLVLEIKANWVLDDEIVVISVCMKMALEYPKVNILHMWRIQMQERFYF